MINKEGERDIKIRRVPKKIWIKFRRLCLDEEISANEKMLHLIEDEVAEEEELGLGLEKKERFRDFGLLTRAACPANFTGGGKT